MKIALNILFAANMIRVASTAHAATISFDTSSDLAEFNLNGNAGSNFKYHETGGVGADGGITSSASNLFWDSAIYKIGSVNSVGSRQYVSLDYKMQLQGTGPDIRVGFTSEANGFFDDTNDIWVETYGPDNPKSFALGNSFTPWTAPSSVTMTPDDWFRLRLDLTKLSPTEYDAIATIFHLGSDGLATPVLLSSQQSRFTSSSLGESAELFSGFYLHSATSAADNFSATSVVPEPSAAILLAGAFVLASTRRRNKAQKNVEQNRITEPLARCEFNP